MNLSSFTQLTGCVSRLALLALTVSLSGVGQAKEQWHVYDVLGNTVASVNADAVVSEVEATAFGESRTPTAGARFTGKPYDADLDANVFPFRNYRSDTGRWTSADPSGFPDGTNGQGYSPVPVSALDPLGLSQQTYGTAGVAGYRHVEGTPDSNSTAGSLTMTIVGTGAHLVNNNAGLFQVDFSVASGVTSGWVVQHIVASLFYYENAQDTTGITRNFNYWEQWEVLSNGSVNYAGRDSFSVGPVGFSGIWTAVGNARYISVADAAGGISPNSWQYGFTNPDTPAGDLRATVSPPSWWSDQNSVSHSIYYSYE